MENGSLMATVDRTGRSRPPGAMGVHVSFDNPTCRPESPAERSIHPRHKKKREDQYFQAKTAMPLIILLKTEPCAFKNSS
jgi:hypothetical protein